MSTMIQKTHAIEKKYSMETAKDRALRYWQYETQSSSDPKKVTALKIHTIVLGTVAKFAIGGGVVGGTIGGVGGACVTKTVPGAISGAKAGASAGAFLGASVGAYLGTQRVNIEIETSDHFRKWKELSIEKEVYSKFQEYVLQNEKLKSLLCPITMEFPMVPVKTPDGLIFEKSNIMRWLDEYALGEQDRHCPVDGAKPFTSEDLEDCPEQRVKISQIIQSELSIDLKPGCYEKAHIVDGLRAVLANLKENHESILDKEAELIGDQFSKGDITHEALLRTAEAIREKYQFLMI